MTWQTWFFGALVVVGYGTLLVQIHFRAKLIGFEEGHESGYLLGNKHASDVQAARALQAIVRARQEGRLEILSEMNRELALALCDDEKVH